MIIETYEQEQIIENKILGNFCDINRNYIELRYMRKNKYESFKVNVNMNSNNYAITYNIELFDGLQYNKKLCKTIYNFFDKLGKDKILLDSKNILTLLPLLQDIIFKK